MKKNTVKLLCLIALLGCFSAQAEDLATHAKVLSQAKMLYAKGDYEAAYKLLSPLENALAGELAYDRFFGKAALAAGHPTESMFALERAASINPDDMQVRTDLAQAHYQLGELASSKAEYQQVLKNPPNAETAKAIEKYLSTIDKTTSLTSNFKAYFETGLGWDSNVNSATTDEGAYAIPGISAPTVGIPEESSKKSTSFLNVAGGVSVVVPATENISYIGNLRFTKKINQRFQAFETGSVDLDVGINFKRDADVYSLTAQVGSFFLDDDRFRHSYGVTGQWQHNINPLSQFSIYAKYAKLDYLKNTIRNADRYVAGVNYARALQMRLKPVVFGGIYIGMEDANKEGTDFLDHHIYGLRAGGQLSVAPRLSAYLSAGMEFRDYKDKDVLKGIKRQDDQYDITVGMNYIPAQYWTVKPQVSYIKNNANDTLFEYDRATVSVNVRRDFNW